MHRLSSKVRSEKAEAFRASVRPVIAEIMAAGYISLRDVAAKLDEAGEPTPLGGGKWSAVQVQRVLAA